MRPNEDKLKRKQQIIEEICEHKINFVHKPNCKIPCEMFDFNTKNDVGLQARILTKHNNSNGN